MPCHLLRLKGDYLHHYFLTACFLKFFGVCEISLFCHCLIIYLKLNLNWHAMHILRSATWYHVSHFKICHMVSCFTFCILNNCIFIMIILIYKIYTYLVLDVGKDEDEIEMISLFATTVSLCHLQLADKGICFSSDGINNKQSWKFSSD